jgi:ATP-dependent Zn protease
MSKGIINAAYHEAGHVLALLLATRRFKYVTIVPENMKDGYGIETSVHISRIPSEIKNQWEIPSFFKPVKFNRFFRNDFINVAGLVAEQIYTGKKNKTGAGGDFEEWINVTHLGLPNKLSSKYQFFLLDYTKEVLELEINWLHITSIAEALIERKTLNYSQVIDVFLQSSKMWKESKQESVGV